MTNNGISNGANLKTGVQERVNFGKIRLAGHYPDLLEIQLKSFQEYFQLETTPENRINEGLYRVFQENFPITDARNIFNLEFLDYFIDPPRYTIDECMQRGLTYSVPLKAKLRLSCNDPEHIDFQTIVQDVFLGNIPYMTPKGTFVINGAERVIVSQLHRSPGVFFGQSYHPNGTKIYSARVIPFKGAWMEFATDINLVMYAYIDRKKKFPVTTLLREKPAGVRIPFEYECRNSAGELLNTGHVTLVCIDKVTNKMCKLPAWFLQAFDPFFKCYDLW